MDWQKIAVESHYLTAVGVKEALEAGDIHAALQGIDELIDAMRRSEQRAVRSQLVRLMMHILKWQVQPTYRSPSDETGPSIPAISLSWDEVFHTRYTLERP
jgi:Domain of unknown function DUF29